MTVDHIGMLEGSAPREAQPIYQVRPRNGEEWTDVSEAEYKICGGAGYVQRILYTAPTPDRAKYDSSIQPGSPLFDGAEAYQAHLEASAERAECAPHEEMKCMICGETEPYTGTCGSGGDPRALCNAAPQAECAPREAHDIAARIVNAIIGKPDADALKFIVNELRSIAPREAQPIYQVRPRNGEEWTDVSEAEYKICGGAGYVQRVIYVAPTPERVDADTAGAVASGAQMDDVSPLVDEWIRSRGTQMDGASYGAAVELSAFIKSKVIERADAETAWPSPKDAAITACALMVKGICATHPKDQWAAKIEERIRFMLKSQERALLADGGKDSSEARDAERYRYLRNCGVIVDFTRSGPWKFTDDVDAAIDKYLERKAAIAGEKK